jgi:hypothetical protein
VLITTLIMLPRPRRHFSRDPTPIAHHIMGRRRLCPTTCVDLKCTPIVLVMFLILSY